MEHTEKHKTQKNPNQNKPKNQNFTLKTYIKKNHIQQENTSNQHPHTNKLLCIQNEITNQYKNQRIENIPRE